jgi:hypothetical protein
MVARGWIPPSCRGDGLCSGCYGSSKNLPLPPCHPLHPLCYIIPICSQSCSSLSHPKHSLKPTPPPEWERLQCFSVLLPSKPQHCFRLMPSFFHVLLTPQPTIIQLLDQHFTKLLLT